MGFFERYVSVTTDKQSVLNLNLDPALPRQRTDLVLPMEYRADEDPKALLQFSLDMIEQVSPYCCSVKPNTQYFLGYTHILKDLVTKIHAEGMLAILDHKLGDIGSTNEAAIFWIAELGFDAFTCSPFAGNLQHTVECAHANDLGVFVLTLMSNPEAEAVMVNTQVEGHPYYLHIANMVKVTHADGCVVGLTSFVKPEYVQHVQRTVGDRVVFLLQGIGPQGGTLANIAYVTNPLVSVGRAVLYADKPQAVIKRYHERIQHVRVDTG